MATGVLLFYIVCIRVRRKAICGASWVGYILGGGVVHVRVPGQCALGNSNMIYDLIKGMACLQACKGKLFLDERVTLARGRSYYLGPYKYWLEKVLFDRVWYWQCDRISVLVGRIR